MITNLTAQDLIDFETDIAAEFDAAHIRAPIHLYSNNEEKMIEIFQKVREQDWVFCTWRSHYQCLLKGVPPEELKKDILNGRSIALQYPNYNIFSSGIVTGCLSIATGVALSIKRKSADTHVYCFLGDMAYVTGQFHECITYVENFNLPITFIVENNGLSVCTDTKNTWGMKELPYKDLKHIIYYDYKNKYPHAGAGKRVQF